MNVFPALVGAELIHKHRHKQEGILYLRTDNEDGVIDII